jgi:hypothetical protein
MIIIERSQSWWNLHGYGKFSKGKIGKIKSWRKYGRKGRASNLKSVKAYPILAMHGWEV